VADKIDKLVRSHPLRRLRQKAKVKVRPASGGKTQRRDWPSDEVANPGEAFVAAPSLKRTGTGRVELCWKFAGRPVEVLIFRGESPESIDRGAPIARTRRPCITIQGLDSEAISYFELVPHRGRPVIVGERRIRAEGAANLRDLGGYRSRDGRHLKWGKIYRSGNLGRLTVSGLARVKRLGIRLVCDFRTEAEAVMLPDRFPDSPDIGCLRLPIQHGEYEPTIAFERIRSGDYDWISEEFMLQGYIDSVERYPDVWARLFECLADPRHRPLLFHCTGGKDRTGVAAALILLALGVPEETVVADYGLSDGYNAKLRKATYDHLRSFGVDIGKVEPYFTAPEGRIRALLEHVNAGYGSAVSYLVEKAGVSEAMLHQLREALLE
jgi:protein-tyrosine phosphatase